MPLDIPTNPRLRIPASRPAWIFDYVCQTLKASERLRCVKEWRHGEAGDVQPGAIPTPAQCPFVRLEIQGIRGGGLRDNVSQAARLVIEVDVFTKGYARADVVDLFSRIVDVVYPTSQTEEAGYRAGLRDRGALGTNVDIEEWASPTPLLGPDGKPLGMMAGRGRLGIAFKIQGPL